MRMAMHDGLRLFLIAVVAYSLKNTCIDSSNIHFFRVKMVMQYR